MRSPANMETIQIEVTNACVHSCSNCTRLCGHHKKPFFMNWETFERAAASLEGFEGVIGIMGGEPTLHPDFKRFALHLRNKHPMAINLNTAQLPLKDYMQYTRNKHNAYRVLNRHKGPGLWTSITNKYYDFFELIQDTFVFQCLNDHMNSSYHQPIMITRSELGISDEEWFKLRDNCWIQNNWSASITPKGAFFCEVAAALDMLFDGPGGWPIEPGWWRRTPQDFSDQLHWCEMCGIALDTFKRNANEEIDDVSPVMYKKLLELDSPKLKQGAVAVYQPGTKVDEDGYEGFKRGQYIADNAQRISKENVKLFPRAVEAVYFCGDKPISDIVNEIKQLNGLDHIFVLASSKNQAEQLEKVQEQNTSVKYYDETRWGRSINRILSCLQHGDWVLFLGQTGLPAEFRAKISGLVFNPGVLYKIDTNVFFNVRAKALLQNGFDGIAQCEALIDFEHLWDPKKVIKLSEITACDDDEQEQWRNSVEAEFCMDSDFRKQFETVMLQAVPARGKIIVTQSASYFLTGALIRLLKEAGFEPCLISHERFIPFFKQCLPQENIYAFNNVECFKFDELKQYCDAILCKNKFEGAVIPYSILHKDALVEDGYQQIEKIARYLGGKVVARVNIKRNFVINSMAEVDSPIINMWNY